MNDDKYDLENVIAIFRKKIMRASGHSTKDWMRFTQQLAWLEELKKLRVEVAQLRNENDHIDD